MKNESAISKKKRTAIIFAVIILISIVLFYPGGAIKCADGGSYGYAALTYSVWRCHSLNGPGLHVNGRYYRSYTVGWKVKILGITIYDEKHIEYEPGLTDSEMESVKEELDRAMNKSQRPSSAS